MRTVKLEKKGLAWIQRSKSSIPPWLPEVDLVNPRQTGQKREPISVSYANISVQPATPEPDVAGSTMTTKVKDNREPGVALNAGQTAFLTNSWK